MKTQIKIGLTISCRAVLLLFGLLVLQGSALAQTSDSLKYFPCDTGDQWLYYVESSPTQGEFKTIKIDSVLSHPLGRLVYMSGDEYRTSQLVVDTSDGFIYSVFSGENPDTVDSLWNPYHLDAQFGDYWPSSPRHTSPFVGVSAMFDTNVFGVKREVKEFSQFNEFEGDTSGGQDHNPGNWFSYFSEQYAYGVGMTYRYVEPGEGWYLLGAVIDGDTLGTITAVNEKKNDIPKTFRLNQNYPNPFNPSTAISYQLSEVSNVTLKIYDVLGKEVKTLIDNDREAPGTHAVIWNGTNEKGERVSSGMYFYRLITDHGILTKKAVYLK